MGAIWFGGCNRSMLHRTSLFCLLVLQKNQELDLLEALTGYSTAKEDHLGFIRNPLFDLF
jgi:hypothetical protein